MIVLHALIVLHVAVTTYLWLSMKIKPIDYSEIYPGMDLIAYGAKHKLRFIRKDKWGLSVMIAAILKKPLPNFQSNYWTTIGPTVGFSTGGPDLKIASFEIVKLYLDKGPPQRMKRPDPLQHYENALYHDAVAFKTHLEANRSTVEHELHHEVQWRRFGWLWGYAYILCPVPLFFAWFRWVWERVPYAYQTKAGYRRWGKLAGTIAKAYWCWPRTWMHRWFERNARVIREIKK